MIVEGTSLVYNIAQVIRFRSMILELSQICNYIVYKVRITGGCTQWEYDLALECQRQIEECNKQIAKHETMTIVDGTSLLIDMLGNLNKKWIGWNPTPRCSKNTRHKLVFQNKAIHLSYNTEIDSARHCKILQASSGALAGDYFFSWKIHQRNSANYLWITISSGVTFKKSTKINYSDFTV